MTFMLRLSLWLLSSPPQMFQFGGNGHEPGGNRHLPPLPVGTQAPLVASWLERGHACLQLSLLHSLLYLLCQTKARDLVGRSLIEYVFIVFPDRILFSG